MLSNFTRSLLSLHKITFLGKYKNSVSAQNVENWMGRGGEGFSLLLYSIVRKGLKGNPDQYRVPNRIPSAVFFLSKPSHVGFGNFSHWYLCNHRYIGTCVSSLKHVMKSTRKKKDLPAERHDEWRI